MKTSTNFIAYSIKMRNSVSLIPGKGSASQLIATFLWILKVCMTEVAMREGAMTKVAMTEVAMTVVIQKSSYFLTI